jgi:hypothetical protein
LQINRSLLFGTILVIIVAAFGAGYGFNETLVHSNTTTTKLTTTSTTLTTLTTRLTYTLFSLSGSNHSIFIVTGQVVVEPEVINGICTLSYQNTTVTTRYYLPTTGITNNSIGILSTSTTFDNESTTTNYQNATIIFGTSTCTEINPYYNVTQTNTGCICA